MWSQEVQLTEVVNSGKVQVKPEKNRKQIYMYIYDTLKVSYHDGRKIYVEENQWWKSTFDTTIDERHPLIEDIDILWFKTTFDGRL